METYGGYDRTFQAYSITKQNDNYTCQDFKKTLIEIPKNFYDNAPFIAGTFPKTITVDDFKRVAPKYNINLTRSGGKTSRRCTDFMDWSWYKDSNTIILDITNKDNKPMEISGLGFYTQDDQHVTTKKINIYIKPFGKLSRKFTLEETNMNVVKSARIFCKVLSKEKKIDSKNSTFQDNNLLVIVGWIISLSFIGFVGYTWYTSQNPTKKNISTKINLKQSSSNNITQSNKIIERVWNGEESMAKTFWLYCILMGMIIGVVTGVLAGLYNNYFYIIAALYIFWSNIGLWNSSTKYKIAKLNQGKPYGWAIAAKIYVVFNFLTTLSQAGVIMSGNF